MFRYPVEKIILRFYKYKFYQVEEAVTVEAFNRQEARIHLRNFILQNPRFHNIPIISETVSLPIVGETLKEINGVQCVWVGNLNQIGWMPLWEYEKLNHE